MILNRQGMADAMGISPPTLDQWVREGCPAVERGGKGRPWKFSLPDVVAWWGNRERENATGGAATDETELRRRAAIANTGVAELNFAKAKGEVATIADFQRAQSKVMAAIRANVMNVPARAALQLVGETDESTFKRILRGELVLALEQSAEAEFTLDDDDDAEGEE